MATYNLLHITDFHLRDPGSTTEHLRRGHFQEYVNGLIAVMESQDYRTIDGIVATGDFVDKGKTENFEHAQAVLAYVAERLEVAPERVIVCPGNHDLVRHFEEGGRLREAREEYSTFSTRFANGLAEPGNRNERATFGKVMDGVWFLSLDSTIGASGKNRAGDLRADEVDEIMDWVRSVPADSVLLIASHHPVDSYIARSAAFDDTSNEWAATHIWWDAAYLRERIAAHRADEISVWFCGDIHRHGQFRERGMAFCTAGRFGVTTESEHGEVRRQATVVRIENGQRVSARRFEYSVEGIRPEAHVGEWTARPVSFRRIVEEDDTPSPRHVAREGTLTNLELIDPDFQHQLIADIDVHSLYHFGRFVTGEDLVSLSWISVGPLLGIGNNLATVAARMTSWVQERVLNQLELPASQVVLIGTDSWGAVFASQISVLTGIHNYCVALRGNGLHNAPEEQVDPSVLREILSSTAVILVADVVASGESLRRVHDAAISKLDPSRSGPRWYAVSILCDALQDRGDACTFLESHGTLCADMRMPVIKAAQLPSETLLPPTLSFR